VFAHGLDPAAGPGLIFQTLPLAFGNMAGGHLFGTLFFVLLTFAAWTSSIGLIEPAVAWSVETRGRSRVAAAIVIGLIVWALGFLTILSFNELENFKRAGPDAVREPGPPLQQHHAAARRAVHHRLRGLGDVQELHRRGTRHRHRRRCTPVALPGALGGARRWCCWCSCTPRGGRDVLNDVATRPSSPGAGARPCAPTGRNSWRRHWKSRRALCRR
jgi:hypothetical protein